MTDYYGVPYECTLTNEIENLAAESRVISLTHAAVSSCRLQRTIMQIGEGVGKAAARAKKALMRKIYLKHCKKKTGMFKRNTFEVIFFAKRLTLLFFFLLNVVIYKHYDIIWYDDFIHLS